MVLGSFPPKAKEIEVEFDLETFNYFALHLIFLHQISGGKQSLSTLDPLGATYVRYQVEKEGAFYPRRIYSRKNKHEDIYHWGQQWAITYSFLLACS